VSPGNSTGAKHIAASPVSEQFSAPAIARSQAQSAMHVFTSDKQSFAMHDQQVPNAVPGA
jgi:hypothetical protein